MSLSQMHLEQYQKLKVLVLDDDRMSAHNLSIQLRFLGETPLFSTSENWLPVLRTLADRGESSNLLAVALGQIRKCDPLDLLLNLHRHSPHLPLMLLCDLDEVQISQLPESLQERLLPLGDSSLDYQCLLTGLQKARSLSGRMIEEVAMLSGFAGPGLLFRSLCGQSPAIQRIRQLFQAIGKRQVIVLLTGESGTGKEVVARNLHYHSGRSHRPFIAVNCAAISPDRQGVELFGQQRKFNGIRADRSGLVEQAEGGTLFLDEIGEMPLPIQALLLRFLEDRTFQRVGGHEYQLSDVRIVAATRQNLEQRITMGLFREDLFYRLAVMPIALPPLRERREDIPELVRELTTALELREQLSVRFSTAALRSLQQHPWPGNVRELANLVERLAILLPNTVIGLNELPQAYQYEVEALEEDDLELDIGGDIPDLSPADLPPFEALAGLGLAVAAGTDGLPSADPVPAEAILSESPHQELTPSEAQPESPDPSASASSTAVDDGVSGVDVTADTAVAQPPVMPPAPPQTSAPIAGDSPAGGGRRAGDGTGMSARKAVSALIDNEYMQALDEERLQEYLRRFERQLLEVALEDCAGFVDFAAGRLNIDGKTLRSRMQEHGLVETA